MSELAIFIVGSIIFAITVYGSVMGGGIALGRLADHEVEDVPDEGRPEGNPVAPARSGHRGPDQKGPDAP